MRYVIFAAVLFAAHVAQAQSQTNSPMRDLPTLDAGATRACRFASGGWVTIDCSNAAAASSSQLTAYTRYVIQCGDDTYFRPGTAASGQAAATTDGWVPSGAWVEFMTDDTIRYISVRNKNSDSDCRILECK